MYIQREEFSSNLPELVAAAVEATSDLQPQRPEDRWAGQSLDQVAARLDRAAGLRLFPDRAQLAARVQAGEITDADLEEAIARTNAPGITVADIRVSLDHAPPFPGKVPTVADLAASATGIDWTEIMARGIGNWAEAHFTPGHALWGENGGMDAWDSWRVWAMHDLTPEIGGLEGFVEFASRTDRDPWRALGEACRALGIDAQAAPSVFERLLCEMWVWTGPHQPRAARDAGGIAPPETVAQFLAIRLVWEQALLTRFGTEIGEAWETALGSHRQPVVPHRDHLIDTILQSALASASARTLDQHLRVVAPAPSEPVAAQLVFTSDARSERFRRALEGLTPDIRTYGVGDSFGLPAEIAIVDGPPPSENRAGLPAVVSDPPAGEDWVRRTIGRVSHALVSSFALVQASGLLQLGALVRRSLGEQYAVIGLGRTPRLDISPTAPEAADLAERALRRMGLTSDLAALVVLVARHSRTWRAPDGNDGKSTRHARALAQLLNETPVRQALSRRGIEIDPKCVFMAAAHDTVSDTVTLYTCDPIGGRYPGSVKRLRRNLERTATLVRAERALDLPGAQRGDDLLYRGGDWAERAPERGTGMCQWFVIGPRSLTGGANLGGAAALHEYEASSDPDGDVLADILATEVLPTARAARKSYLAAMAPSLFGADASELAGETGGLGQLGAQSAVSPGERADELPGRLIVRVAVCAERLEKALTKAPGLVSLQHAGWVDIASVASGDRPRVECTPKRLQVDHAGL